MRIFLVLLAAVITASPCRAQDSAPAHQSYSLLSLSAGAAAGINASDVDAAPLLGVQFTRLVPRTPGIDAGFDMLWTEGGSMPDGSTVTRRIFLMDLGVAYALPVSRVVNIVPGAGLTTAATSDAESPPNAGVYVGAHTVWHASQFVVKGSLTWRGFGVFHGEISSLVSAMVGVGLVL